MLHVAVQLAALSILWPGALRFSFDAGPDHWKPSALDKGSQVAYVTQAHGRRGVLKISGRTPPSFGGPAARRRAER